MTKIQQQAPDLLTMNVTNTIVLTNPLPILHNLADFKAMSATCAIKTQHCWQISMGIHSFPLLATAAITGPHHWQKTSGIPSSSDATAACPCWGGATLSWGRGRACLSWSTDDQSLCQPETTGTRNDFKSMSSYTHSARHKRWYQIHVTLPAALTQLGTRSDIKFM